MINGEGEGKIFWKIEIKRPLYPRTLDGQESIHSKVTKIFRDGGHFVKKRGVKLKRMQQRNYPVKIKKTIPQGSQVCLRYRECMKQKIHLFQSNDVELLGNVLKYA